MSNKTHKHQPRFETYNPLPQMIMGALAGCLVALMAILICAVILSLATP